MKPWHKVTHWSWRSSKSSKSKTPPSKEPAQAEETPVQVAHNTRILLAHGHEGSCHFSRFGQTPAYGNHEEEEKTTADPSHRAYGAKEFVSEEECRGEDCPNVRLLRKQESPRTGDQEEIQKLRATLLQQKHDLERNEKMALARLKVVEDEKDVLEVALGAERANTATQQKTMYTLRGKNVAAQSVEVEPRNQVEALKQERSQAEELRATLLQLKDDVQRNEKMAVARLKAVEDEKAALEVALGAERAITAMQQEKMSQAENEVRATSLQLKDELQRNESELCATLLQLKDGVQRNEKMAVARLKAVEDEKAALEVALGAEKANTAMQQEKMSQAENEARSTSLQLKDDLRRNESEVCATLLQLKDDVQRNEKMAVARLKAVEDEKAALEVALGAERAITAMQQEKMSQAENEARSTSLRLKDELQRNESELCATLLQLKDGVQRNEKMAVARLKAVEDEKSALEVALGAERAITAMQREKMSQAENEARSTSLRLKDELRRNESELCATLLQLKDGVQRNEKMAVARLKAVEDEKSALEVALGAERANTAMQQKTMYTLRGERIEAQSVEVELRNQVKMLKEKMSQEAEVGRRQTKEEKIRSGVARLIEKDLRKQVATLEQSRMQQADEIRRLLTQVLQQNEEPHIDSVVTFGRAQGFNATASALGDGHPDCPRLHADFYPGWEAPVGVAIVGMFRITVPAGVRGKHLSYVRSHGNVVQCFHGTSCRSACNFILDPKKAAPCGLQDCNVCNICLQGFKIGKNSTRYGRGVYFSKQATKANSYAGGSEKKENGKKLRCIFVADVAKGRDFVTKKTGFDGARYPPVGHDSVKGEVGNGLDFEELVVYHEEAAIPTHLIVYTVP